MQTFKNTIFVILENIDYFLIFLLLFIAVFALIFGIISLLMGGPKEIQSRLSRLLGRKLDNLGDSARPKFLERDQPGLVARFSKPLHQFAAPDDRSMRNKLRLRLVQAGCHSEKAFHTYLAVKVLLPFLLIGIYLVTRVFYSIALDTLFGIVVLGLLGYFTPNTWLLLMRLDRQRRIFKGLPDALDLMVVCVEAGLGLDMTFKRVGDEIRKLCPDLADEFTLTTLEIRAGKTREEAFRDMAIRCNIPEVSNLMTVLSQTSRFGTSLATALRIHADGMRVKRRQIAEEQAAKSTVKLIFPLVLFIFPAIFVVIIGPGAIKIARHLLPALGG